MPSRPDDWTPEQRWAYALGAPYHLWHDLPVDSLPKPDRNTRDTARTMLKRDWSVESAEDLVRTLNWLGQSGHRLPHRRRILQYCLLRRPAIAARREELREIGARDPAAIKELWRLDAVQADWNAIRGAPLIGFDAARAVMLVRCGLMLEWIEPAVAWRFLGDVAADVRRSLASWTDYAADLRRGRALWGASPAQESFDAAINRLLTDRRGPWRTLPWELPGLSIPRPVPPNLDGPAWVLER